MIPALAFKVGSRVFGGKMIAGASVIVIAFAVAAGWKGRDILCDAAALRVENARITGLLAERDAIIAEKDRQIKSANDLQKQDAARASALEIELRRNQDEIDATPHNPVACLDRNAAGRVRRVN